MVYNLSYEGFKRTERVLSPKKRLPNKKNENFYGYNELYENNILEVEFPVPHLIILYSIFLSAFRLCGLICLSQVLYRWRYCAHHQK